MTTPITITSSRSKWTITGYPVLHNGCKGFLIINYTDTSNNFTHHFASGNSCHGLLVSDDMTGITGVSGWSIMGRQALDDPIPSLHEELSPYFNKSIDVSDLNGWYIIDNEFPKRTVERWLSKLFDNTDHLLFETLL